MTKEQFEFIHNDVILGNSFSAAFQRNRIYQNKDETDANRKKLRSFLSEELIKLRLEVIKNGGINPVELTKKILDLSVATSTQFHSILNSRRFKIGTSQKLINIFLKYCWCIIPDFPEPPHCPVDRIILEKLPYPKNGISWTQLDNIQEYSRIIDQIRLLAKGQSLSQWELAAYKS